MHLVRTFPVLYAKGIFAMEMLTTKVESASRSTVATVKSISFRYTASQELSSLFEGFRLMCNDAIMIAVNEKPSNRFRLIELAYTRLKEYGLHTHFILSACEVAYSVYRNNNRKCVPRIRKAFLKLDNQSYQLNHLLLRIPASPRHFIFLTLEGSDYHVSFIDDPSLKRGSITVTERSVSIAFSKMVPVLEPLGYVGVDVNEKNVTISSTNGYNCKFTEPGEVVEIKERYRGIRAEISRKTRGDKRISKALLSKYGNRERNRTSQRVHKITRQIIDFAKENELGIKVEKLKGIRKLFRKGNGQGRSFRGRMNTWVFGETRRQIEYKAAWLGVPVYHVNPRGTSRKCPNCGSRVAPLQDRKLYCQKCDKTWDRDDLASKNIMACAVPQARPPSGSCEGDQDGDGSNPPSRWREGRLRSTATGKYQNLNINGTSRE
jgi:putative transposase